MAGKEKKDEKLRHYYQVVPQPVEKKEYKDIDYADDWMKVIPDGLDEKGKLKDFWFRDETLTAGYRRDAEDKKKYVVSQRFACAFDIETNSYVERNDFGKIEVCEGYAYHMQIIIDDTIIHCHKWWQVEHIFRVMKEKLHLMQPVKDAVPVIRMWDANLAFEFSFLSHRFSWSRIFAAHERKPITAMMKDGILLQDALMISGCSLAKTAKMYSLPTRKKDDLDYRKMRTSETPLTAEELMYTSCDVRILAEFHSWCVKNYIDNDLKMPITKTQILRDSIKKTFYETEICGRKGLSRFGERLKGLHFQSYDEYSEMMRFLFRGGYTHANCVHAGKVMKDVYGWDFTSSYPYCMLFCKYPMSPFSEIKYTNMEQIRYDDELGYAIIAKIRFHGIRPKTQHSIESISKTVEYEEAMKEAHDERMDENIKKKEGWYEKYMKKVQPVIDNGRIMMAKQMTVWLTELDIRVYSLFYDWDSCEILKAKRAAKDYLPDYVRYPVMIYYQRKSQLKKAGQDKTTAYLLAKEMVNAGYGMMCEKLHISEIVYDEEKGWYEDQPKPEEVDGKYEKEIFGEDYAEGGKKPVRNKLPAVWGIYTTSTARYNLLTMVAKINADALYCDTDSVYVSNYKKYAHWIEMYNREVRKRNGVLIEKWNEMHRGNEKIKPIRKEDFLDLGTFDPISKGGLYTRFKTLGAKRYLKESKEEGLEQTVAGLPKGKLKEWCERNGYEPFSFFEDEMVIPNVKNAHCYNDEAHERIITDEDGRSELMQECSSCGIFEVDFGLSMSDLYMQLIEDGLEETLRKWYKGEYYGH